MDYLTYDALVIGTGAAGFNAAIRIRQEGKKTVAIVTEGRHMGISRNTGSDKQTYYKLGLGGSCCDSVRKMAEDLFAGGAVDGDNALCEAALSARCFLNLCELGVPFPANRFGEYVGYKTDHDPYARATSAGPLTSKFMTEALEKRAAELEIPVYDGLYAAEILKDETGVCGLLCLEKRTGAFRVFRTAHLVLATGGPGGIYADSVYPECHTGSSSLAFLAGAEFQNMALWQYGLASAAPRWNVSGTYMQVLPRFVSVDAQGVEREFLLEHFPDPFTALSMVFLKGYQWPFDSRKAQNGSSVIDLLVWRERVALGRKVYLDYRKNPFGLAEIDFARLSDEAGNYLRNAGACFGTPVERLLHMNFPAYELYRGKGVDLKTQMLEIALCAQHNNGGISVDLWWQTTVPGLFAAGECAGTHGISRPGGSALNAGQVGAFRAAQFISQSQRTVCEDKKFAAIAGSARKRNGIFAEKACTNARSADAAIAQARRRMSDCGGAVREKAAMESALEQTRAELHTLDTVGVGSADCLYKAYQYRDTLVCQLVCLSSMLALPETPKNRILQGRLDGDVCRVRERPVRPVPADDDFFENVWRGYRQNKNVY